MLTPTQEIISPDSADAALAKQSGRSLASRLGRKNAPLLEFRDGDTGETVKLPTSAARALLSVLTEMGQGHAVQVTPIHAELSTQQAADILNVSRPYLVKLVDDGAIPSRKVGVQRRLLLDDVVAYKRTMFTKQIQGMAELAELSQELGLNDDPPK
jgi:excisionase family DNA binding protein